jgi:hypothetical protein
MAHLSLNTKNRASFEVRAILVLIPLFGFGLKKRRFFVSRPEVFLSGCFLSAVEILFFEQGKSPFSGTRDARRRVLPTQPAVSCQLTTVRAAGMLAFSVHARSLARELMPRTRELVKHGPKASNISRLDKLAPREP